jgi:hypothetical protein
MNPNEPMFPQPKMAVPPTGLRADRLNQPTAEIKRRVNARVFRYIVQRKLGLFTPEREFSHHITLRGARRAARRHITYWEKRKTQTVERVQ